MKRFSFNLNKSLVVLFIAGFVMAAMPASASKNKQTAVKATIEPTVEYIGSDDNSTLLSVGFEKDSTIKFDMVVTDANGTQLFAKSFEASKFSKYLKFVNESNDGASPEITVTIKVPATGEVHQYNMSNSSRTVKDVAITKL